MINAGVQQENISIKRYRRVLFVYSLNVISQTLHEVASELFCSHGFGQSPACTWCVPLFGQLGESCFLVLVLLPHQDKRRYAVFLAGCKKKKPTWLQCGHWCQWLWGPLWRHVNLSTWGQKPSEPTHIYCQLDCHRMFFFPVDLSSVGKEKTFYCSMAGGRKKWTAISFWQRQERGDLDHQRSYDGRVT